jgi:hypothetical protein
MLGTLRLHWSYSYSMDVPHDDITRDGDAAGKDCEPQLESMRHKYLEGADPPGPPVGPRICLPAPGRWRLGANLSLAKRMHDEIGACLAD